MAARRLFASAIALSAGVAACGGGGTPPAHHLAAARFLTRYVEPDGRVIRRDQGGDITSEGQAYAMLIAEAAGHPALVRTIWSWTSAHLRRPDGLIAWHATGGGQVQDPESAADADILTAFGLLRYSGPRGAQLHQAGRRLAAAVLAHESVPLPDGALLPVAGPWAVRGSPPTVNPSYLMPAVLEALAGLTGDSRWRKSALAAVTLVAGLTGDGRRLPPDWAVLAGDRLSPTPRPGGGAGVRYGLDAARLPVWFATACNRRARTIAARWWRDVLAQDGRPAAGALRLDGDSLQGRATPLTLIAGAAAATAAGDELAARSLRRRAEALALRAPTYYGDAWAALGAALLDGAIDPCSDA
jgi:endo-1,4-beta-D-glucanase Y